MLQAKKLTNFGRIHFEDECMKRTEMVYVPNWFTIDAKTGVRKYLLLFCVVVFVVVVVLVVLVVVIPCTYMMTVTVNVLLPNKSMKKRLCNTNRFYTSIQILGNIGTWMENKSAFTKGVNNFNACSILLLLYVRTFQSVLIARC